MPLDFPNSPSIGDTYTASGITWRWDGVRWTSMAITATDGPFLPLAGGEVVGATTFSGGLTVTGSAVLSGGGTLSGSYTGNPVLSGVVQISGRLNMLGIPTSNAGLSSGDVWSNGGVMMVMP